MSNSPEILLTIIRPKKIHINMEFIDFRSDTVTLPTPSMKEAMINAPLGDDVYGDDPTVIELEKLAAETLGKEAALFVPSGTFGNQLCIYTHCIPGQEVIIGDTCHIVMYEAAGTAIWSKTQLRTLKPNKGALNPVEVEAKIRKNTKDVHSPETALICVENPSSGGCVVPLENFKQIREIADKYKLPVHLDGARLFNAATALGVDVKEITKYVDTLMFCISKGLCAPVGSLIAGPKEFILKARKNRKMFGGTMRQAGVLAAAGIVALKEIVPRLGEDHKNAKLLASELSKFEGIININVDDVHINTVTFTIVNEKIEHQALLDHMLKHGIKFKTPRKNGIMRLMTHYYITEEHVRKTIKVLKEYFEEVLGKEVN